MASSAEAIARQALGDSVRVERTRHLLSDDDRCAYRIEKAGST